MRNYGVIILLIALFALAVCLLTRIIVLRKRSRSFSPSCHSAEQVADFNAILKEAGFAYDPRQDIFYSLQDCWQRKFGYRMLFDEIAPTLRMVFDCEPIVFEYEGEQWMIELWKGQYDISTGAEVGIYVADGEDRYRSAFPHEELSVRYHLWKDGQLLATREQKGWWMTSFCLGEFSRPQQLKMVIEITFFDGEMSEVFWEALLEKGYSRSDAGICGNTVRINYRQPLSRQPMSHSGYRADFVMFINRIYCALFSNLTKKYEYTLDKMEYLKLCFPIFYRSMEKILFARGKKNE